MRKIKQVDRPYLVYRYGRVGRTLYDSQTTLPRAKQVAESRHNSHPSERVEIYLRGLLVHYIDSVAPSSAVSP